MRLIGWLQRSSRVGTFTRFAEHSLLFFASLDPVRPSLVDLEPLPHDRYQGFDSRWSR